MDVATIVLTVLDGIAKYAPQVIQTIGDLKPFANYLSTQLSGGPLSDADQAALEAKVDELAARLQISLPAAQPGDPDYTPPPTPAA